MPPLDNLGVWALERDGRGWRDPVRLGAGILSAAALSPDRSRIAVAAVGWPAGKAWVLGGLEQDPPYVFYQEP